MLLTPVASAADRWGPGFLIPDDSGHAGMSHLGAYGPPGKKIPGIDGLAYCADPMLAGPEASGGYGPVKEYSSWTSATGRPVPEEDAFRAAYVLSKYGQTQDDLQAAAVDAATYTFLGTGSAYALPDGKRAVQRLTAAGVPAAAKTRALAYVGEAKKLAGPYKVSLKTQNSAKPGEKVSVTLGVTAASGAKVPGVKVRLTATGAGSGMAQVTTGTDGTATTSITAGKDGDATVKAVAKDLPGTTLRAAIPSNMNAQRMLVLGGTSSAEAQSSVKVADLAGGIKVAKTAADTGKPLANVEFEIKDRDGKVAAKGKTDAEGLWQVKDLAPGEYTVHETRAVEGYQLAPDQTVTVTSRKAVDVAVKDAKIPAPQTPKPRPVTIKVLPQTGV
ncbi:collagen binding domain-containing protein [Streptomyces sp. UNOB3_S3]|uniref:MSCRAMM family protein n=1 Tax=Streptomyces sp. UNOB3_S3 TaxID=2871682 RepID=UPI001E556912|nr:SpaA isopeptide-forming pilin-related protein [Streptomyces sp. UNOB3_S3]MCC3773791.1 prealbumin-like fold domain-containing protein [Streptomyces sp. UNOB3_S3]